MNLALRYRPQKFSEVIGQNNSVKILRELALNRTDLRITLLAGMWGIGKTTLARLYAKLLNCEHPVDGDVCGECKSCESMSGITPRHPDYSERDMGSSGLVADVRRLKDEATMKPSWKFRVFTLDEIHGACMSAGTEVLLADGTSACAIQLIEKKRKAAVLSVERGSGIVEAALISGWHDNGGSDDWRHLSWEGGQGYFTPEHKFLVGGHYVELRDLGKEFDADAVVWNLGQVQRQVLLGTLLGDSSIVKERNAAIQFMQGKKQLGYLLWKVRQFGPLISGMQGRVKDRLCTRTWTKHDSCFNEFLTIKGENGNKNLTSEWLAEMGPLAWAVWYMDDGSLSACGGAVLSCTNLGRSGAQLVCDRLESAYGIQASIYEGKELRTRLKKNPIRIRIGRSQGVDKFFSMIAPFVHPDLLYKLPDGFCPKSLPEATLTQVVRELSLRVAVTEERPAYSKKFTLTVEKNHNYVHPGGLISKNSKESFNALLKILEEPPANAAVVMCTTALNQVPYAIVSRSLVLMLDPLTPELMRNKLMEVTEKEGVKAETTALAAIASYSSGSMRDCYMTFERLQVLGAGNITTEVLAQEPWFISSKLSNDLVVSLVRQDRPLFLSIVKSLTSRTSYESLLREALRKLCRHYIAKGRRADAYTDALWRAYLRVRRGADPDLSMDGLWTECTK